VVIPAVEAGLQRGTLVMQPEDSSLQSKISLPVLVAAANMLAMVFLDSQFTNYDSRNDLRFAHHVQHPSLISIVMELSYEAKRRVAPAFCWPRPSDAGTSACSGVSSARATAFVALRRQVRRPNRR
jgi:hypothetical protein